MFAAVKTSLNDGSTDPNLAQEVLVVFKPGTGAFEQTTIARTGDCVSRPQIMLDTENNLVRAFHTAPSTTVSGCAFSGVAGSIYEKTASMDNPVFGTGRGTAVIEDANSANMNNVTSTKQSVNSATGIVVMATDHVARRYWFSDRSLGTPPPPPGDAPVASFTASPTSGTAPLDGELHRHLHRQPDLLGLGLRRRRNRHRAEPLPHLHHGRDLHRDADRHQRSRL